MQKCLDYNTQFYQDSEKYVKICEEGMVGIYIILYAKQCIRPHIKNLAMTKMKLGVANMANKGCCSIRF